MNRIQQNRKSYDFFESSQAAGGRTFASVFIRRFSIVVLCANKQLLSPGSYCNFVLADSVFRIKNRGSKSSGDYIDLGRWLGHSVGRSNVWAFDPFSPETIIELINFSTDCSLGLPHLHRIKTSAMTTTSWAFHLLAASELAELCHAHTQVWNKYEARSESDFSTHKGEGSEKSGAKKKR